MKEAIFSSPYFGVFISIFAYQLGLIIQKKLNHPFANPLVLSVIFILLFLNTFDISIEAYQKGGAFITLLLPPATAVLAVPIYKNFQILKQHFFPIVIGALVGSFGSMTVIFLLSKAFGLDQQMTASLLAKSVTTPIAMEITGQLGGMVPIAIAAVIFTGITGGILAPGLIKVFGIKDPVVQGVAIGTSSHAVGTSKAIALGETQGAMSGIAMGLSGLFTVFLSYLFVLFL